MRDCHKLDVWTKSHEFALDVRRETASARADTADLVARLRRVAAEVPLRIARGCAAESAGEFLQAMDEAARLVEALTYWLLFARDAGAISDVPYARLEARANQLRAMLGGLTRTVRRKLAGGRRTRPAMPTPRMERVEAPAQRAAAPRPAGDQGTDSLSRRSRA